MSSCENINNLIENFFHLHSKNQCPAYDLVIIGAGTSGITIGYLASKKGLKVLMLEAGEDYDENPEIVNSKPIGALETEFLNEFFWNTQIKPNPNLPNERHNHITGGRALGGTSTVNDQIYWRGTLDEYKKFGGLFTDSSYVIQAFKAIETYIGNTQDPNVRGLTGPFTIRQTTLVPGGTKMANALHDSLLKPQFGGRNIPVVADFNAVNGPAISPQSQVWIKPTGPLTGQRQSTSQVLLKDRKSKVKYKTSATILRIIIDEKTKKAIGVAYLHKNKVKYACANTKIILAAGVRSCKILMLSGYGPKNLLKNNNIKVIYDNPNVGIRLRNHLFVTPVFSCPPDDNRAVARNQPGGTALNKDLSMMARVQAPSDPNDEVGSLEYAIINISPGVAVMAIILNNPDSSGDIQIFTNDPLHEMIVNLPSLSSPIDVDKLVQGVKIYQDMITSTPGYGFITAIPSSDADIATFVKNNANHIHHYTGTCSIGNVVDEHLNVIGIENLMVADASIEFPTIRGHTYASAMLIGIVAYTEITGDKHIKF